MENSQFSKSERVFPVEEYFKNGCRYTESVKRKFLNQFQRESMCRMTLLRLVDKFRKTGSVLNSDRCAPTRKITPDKLSMIEAKMKQSPTKSVRTLASETDLSVGATHGALRHQSNLFPYKMSTTRSLKDVDPETRLTFCRWILRHTAVLLNIFFSDEAWFTLSGNFNSPNTRYWSTRNPHKLAEQPAHDSKIGVWAAISPRRIYFNFFTGRLTLKDTSKIS